MSNHHLVHASTSACAAFGLFLLTGTAEATSSRCPVTHAQLKDALVRAASTDSTGFNNDYWGVVVNHEGVVCAVAFSGAHPRSQWIASRQIAAAKAFTAYGLSLDIGTGTGAFSTAQLYPLVQPGINTGVAPLFGLAGGNVLDSEAAYKGDFHAFGTEHDPMVGERVGGTITFGGGLALYYKSFRVGGLGISGDTACADHSVAWLTRQNLGLEQNDPQDKLSFATTGDPLDGHPHCKNDGDTKGVK